MAQDNASEVDWYAVGLARVEQQYYIYNSTFDPTEHLTLVANNRGNAAEFNTLQKGQVSMRKQRNSSV